MTDLAGWLGQGLDAVHRWQRGFADYPEHPAQRVDPDRFQAAFTELTERLTDNYPYFHPDYAGQMLKPPHPVAVAGYLTAMLVNPNNHALDGGPATARMEVEAIAALAGMVGFGEHLGHLTGGGTVANLEALFVARESHPGLGVAFSAQAHYTHARMCHLLGVPAHPVAVDAAGRMDLDALTDLLDTGTVGTVVLTAGTTGLGAVDPIHDALALRERYGVRLHVDAAYGGFFTLLAGDDPLVDPRPWRAIAHCDSVVIDPHKHGLQPYGCGAVLFADPTVERFYRHDSPYTYFTDGDLHLGEISLECSRPGAVAAALWLTLQVIPPTREGLGEFLAAGRRAALTWADLLEKSPVLDLHQTPELDIVTYFPRRDTLSAVDAATARVFTESMRAPDPVFLSVLTATAADLTRRHPALVADRDRARLLRSVLMKPESLSRVERLHQRIEDLAA
ncbi:aspartate aminotransferase family protein [Actinophytocola xinjiangensis]|uniref:Aspartate aminotransferase family protein n=1 Tax=Actinophytocola xinjiangensis TaxID=485602 RepID=A0A7Z0WMV2_9PSEU|nr:aminotransferase class I/II-fold pyridoxal phosphate-dependent enzyme [Actinophytocola xinjiangensis]OLF11102.1 aspartate aminotransferase family protein [Actinophytocola xinjiangensis]